MTDSDAAILVIGSARCVAGKRALLVEQARAMTTSTANDEGCLFYSYTWSLEDPDVVVSTEVWASSDALDAHMDHDHTHAFMTTLSDTIVGTPTLARQTLR